MDWTKVLEKLMDQLVMTFVVHENGGVEAISATFDNLENIVNTPQSWDNVSNIEDWRNYVAESIWNESSPEERAAMFLFAQMQVSREEWD